MSSIPVPSSRDSYLFSYRYLTCVNLITCGTELCSSAAFSYLPPLLLEAGYSESGMSTVMALGPFLALFLLPVMGTASDQCTSRYGRRRPFIFFLSVGIIAALMLLPNSAAVATRFQGYIPAKPFSLILIAFAVVLLDFCSQICYTPIESLLSDSCQTESQRNRSFAVFSLMMSLGACLGYLVVSVNWEETEVGRYFGGQQRTLFMILLILFSLTLVISFHVAHDPPINLPLAAETQSLPMSHNPQVHKLNGSTPQLPILDGKATPVPIQLNGITLVDPQPSPRKQLNRISAALSTYTRCSLVWKSCCQLCSSCLPTVSLDPIRDTIRGMRTMPVALQRLWWAHLMTSMAVMGFRLYFTDYVGESIYHGNPDSPAGSLSRLAYENGIRMGSFGLLLHSVLSAVFAVVIGPLISSWGSVQTYLFGIVVFTAATFFMLFIDSIAFTLLLAAFTGFANATITTVPYTLLTSYHQKKEVYLQDAASSSADLHGKGADLALLDSAYILSEVISSFAFGVVVELTKSTGAYIACAFVSSLASAFLILRIK
ncbi:solute carrier family 45 member 3-like [Diadema antillarum]|uniref:solute carrier family 45 member 3-like n=1 Tax=Diadema antillarum TaxID=105358 RepID=UPI003A8BD893